MMQVLQLLVFRERVRFFFVKNFWVFRGFQIFGSDDVFLGGGLLLSLVESSFFGSKMHQGSKGFGSKEE